MNVANLSLPGYSRRAVLVHGGGSLAALVLGACGDDDNGSDSGDDAPGAGEAVTEFTIVAENIAWDLVRVVVPAGREVTATIDNRDRGILHNLHVTSRGDPKTDLEKGPVTQTLRFTVEQPGSYEFVCDAHPNMIGTVVVV